MLQQQQLSSSFRVEVGGGPLPDTAQQSLVSVVVDDSWRLPDLFTLTFRDPNRSVLAAAGLRIGAEVRIALVSGDAPGGEPLVTGEVTAVETEVDPTGVRTTVRGYDQSHRLLRGRHTETYVNATASEVAGRVARRAGLRPGEITSTSTVHEHLSQGNVSDWQFLWALAEEVGYEVAVRDGKLNFRPPQASADAPGSGDLERGTALQLVVGSNVLRLHASVTAAEQVERVVVRGWDTAAKQALTGTAAAATTSAVIGEDPAGLAGRFGGGELVGTGVPYRTQPEVDAAAAALAEDVASGFAELEGVARGNPHLRAGSAVSLGLAGEPFDGQYTLTSTRHVYDPEEGYTTAFTVSGRRERSMLGLVGGGRSGTPAGGGGPHLPGVAPAEVTDVRDPDSLARVKLRFPWLSDTYVSDWARTVQPGAGADRGQVVLPEVGDEVLVAFEQGDLRRPYVVGGLHNGVDTPMLGDALVDGSTGAVNRRGFVSRAGHRLVFLDGDGDQGVTLMTGDQGYRLALNQSGTTIRLHSDGTVEIEADQEVTITAGSDCTVEAGGTLTLKGQQVQIEGSQVKIDASGPAQVKGNPIQLN